MFLAKLDIPSSNPLTFEAVLPTMSEVAEPTLDIIDEAMELAPDTKPDAVDAVLEIMLPTVLESEFIILFFVGLAFGFPFDT